MFERLLKARVALVAVLQDESVIRSADRIALSVDDTTWSVAEAFVKAM